MTRKSFPALIVLALAFGPSQGSAEEIQGKMKTVDLEKGTITLAVGTADRVYPVATDVKVVGLFGKKIKKAKTKTITDGLKGVKEGSSLTLTTEKREDRDVVSQVKVDDLQPKAKAKAKVKKNKKKNKKKNA